MKKSTAVGFEAPPSPWVLHLRRVRQRREDRKDPQLIFREACSTLLGRAKKSAALFDRCGLEEGKFMLRLIAEIEKGRETQDEELTELAQAVFKREAVKEGSKYSAMAYFFSATFGGPPEDMHNSAKGGFPLGQCGWALDLLEGHGVTMDIFEVSFLLFSFFFLFGHLRV
jgi:hypothetical protein